MTVCLLSFIAKMQKKGVVFVVVELKEHRPTVLFLSPFFIRDANQQNRVESE